VTPTTTAGGMSTVQSLGSATLNLLLVLALIFALAWVLRRIKGRGGQGHGPLRIKSTLALTMKERLVLVDAAGEHLLLGVSPSGITCLHRYATPPADTVPDAEFSFASLLRRQAPKDTNDAR